MFLLLFSSFQLTMTSSTNTHYHTQLHTDMPPKLFIHAQFEVPKISGTADDGNDHVDDGDCSNKNITNDDDGGDVSSSTSAAVITKQVFDASNCKTAMIGLPDGVEPTKV